ncbi:N-acetylmuramoyl-L-alanine amidase LytC [Rubritalea halochordaticola]|uniref:N-acetylmuramoyl-L-alanine amidase n=1 Tax=Rubritalea halochordaticola TaxID=714537 RepID=A0ABP9UYP4_9BACT
MKIPRLPQFTLILLAVLSMVSFASAAKFSRVILDPGHGGKDKGAIWGGVRESDLNLKVARKVETLLKARGIPVTMTRRSDQFISLSKRANIANNYRGAIFVSIHFNASTHTSVRGLETYYASAKGKALAQQIHSRMVKKLNIKDRKTRLGAKYAVLNQTHCPAILVECGYISNPYERKRCSSSWYQSLCASAIVDGIVAYR